MSKKPICLDNLIKHEKNFIKSYFAIAAVGAIATMVTAINTLGPSGLAVTLFFTTFPILALKGMYDSSRNLKKYREYKPQFN